MSSSSSLIVPSICTPSTRSFMRLKQRSRVDFPQPEGPIKAVTRFLGSASEMFRRASLLP